MKVTIKSLYLTMAAVIFLTTANSYAADLQSIKDKILLSGKARVIAEIRVSDSEIYSQDKSGHQSASIQDSIQGNRIAIDQTFNQLEKTLNAQGITVTRKFRNLPYFTSEINLQHLERLLRNSNVVSLTLDTFSSHQLNENFDLSPVVPVEPSKKSSTTREELARPLLNRSTENMNVDDVWEQGGSGFGQVIAILDDGIFADHDMFKNKIAAEACFGINDDENVSFCPNGLDTQIGPGAASGACEDFSELGVCTHGSHVAGIAAGNDGTGEETGRGVAYGADLLPVQVFQKVMNAETCEQEDDPEPKGCKLSSASVQMAAMDYLIDLKADHIRNNSQGMNIAVVNMSLGKGGFETACSDPRSKPIKILRSMGVITVIAAGNEGFLGKISQPGCIAEALTVAASDTQNRPYLGLNHAPLVDVLAPGLFISSAAENNGYRTASGTSMAAPHAAGAVAILKSAMPSASADRIENALKLGGTNLIINSRSVRFTVEGDANSSLDPYLIIRDKNGRFLDQDDDSGSGTDAELDFKPASSSSYFINVRDLTGGTGSYTIRTRQWGKDDEGNDLNTENGATVNPEANGSDVPGDKNSTASFNLGETVQGNISRRGDQDWFKVTLEGGNEWVTPLINLSSALSYLNNENVAQPSVYLSQVYASNNADRESIFFVRNDSSSAGTLTITLVDDEKLGVYESTVDPKSTLRLTMDEIEEDLNAPISPSSEFRALSAEITSEFSGYVQHRVYFEESRTLTNGSISCSGTVESGLFEQYNSNYFMGLHTINLPEFPSYLTFVNTGGEASKPNFTVEDMVSGEKLGSYTTVNAIEPKGSMRISLGSLSNSIDKLAGQKYMNVSATYDGITQHWVYSSSSKVFGDMSSSCQL